MDSSARGPGFKSRQEQEIKFCWNIAFFDQKKGVYERDFALPSLRIPLRVPKLYLGWYWSSNCDVQSSSCARVRTRAPSYQMERSQCMLSYNSTCRFNTGSDRRVACPIQWAACYFSKIEKNNGSSGQTWTLGLFCKSRKFECKMIKSLHLTWDLQNSIS